MAGRTREVQKPDSGETFVNYTGELDPKISVLRAVYTGPSTSTAFISNTEWRQYIADKTGMDESAVYN